MSSNPTYNMRVRTHVFCPRLTTHVMQRLWYVSFTRVREMGVVGECREDDTGWHRHSQETKNIMNS